MFRRICRIHSPLRAVAAVAALTAALACGGGRDSTSPGGGESIVITPGEAVTISNVADSVKLSAMVGDSPAVNLLYRLTAETRGLADLPVLAAGPLKRGVLVAAGPGTATITVTAAKARATTLIVQVLPDGPTIFAAFTTLRGTGNDTTTLVGVRLDELGEDPVSLGGAAAPVLARSATSIKVATPAAPTACTALGLEKPVAVTGAATVPSLKLWLPRAGEVRLEPGEWTLLSAEEAACLRIPAADSAQYVLAYADFAPFEAARTEWAPPPWSNFSVAVTDRANAAALVSAGSSARGQAVQARRDRAGVSFAPSSAPVAVAANAIAEQTAALKSECSDTDFTNLRFWCRSKPWQVGDKLRIRRPHSATSDTVMATVYQIYGGRFAFAAIDGDNSAGLAQLRSSIQAAMPGVLQVSVPLLELAYGNEFPTTSVGSGQLLTVIGDFQHGSVGGGCCAGGNGPWSALALGNTLAAPQAELFYLLTHEFTHAWQVRWFHDSRLAESSPFAMGSYWAVEGTADLLALEAVRRYAVAPWATNSSWDDFVRAPGLGEPMARELGVRGSIAQGYHEASSFLRDLVARLVRAGVHRDVAFREVARGGIEGWYGFDSEGVQRQGLAGRVRPHLGAGWEPGNAFLLYLLAQGADDRTNATALQNPFWQYIWTASTELRGLELTAGSGGHLESEPRLAMSGGVARLKVLGRAGAFETTSTEPQVRWAIARVQ